MEEWQALVARQDGMATRRQALMHFSEKAVDHRLGRHWKVVLPGVYAVQTGPLTERQRLRAGLLHAGDGACLNDVTALRLYKARYLPADPAVRVLVPADNQRSSRDFVVIRRTRFAPRAILAPGAMPIVPMPRALADFALRHDDDRTVRAVLGAAVQQRQVELHDLCAELEHAQRRGRARFMRALEELGAGVRSAPEGDVRSLVATSKILPTPLYNCLLRLPDGRKVSPDMLIEEAALVHETNGRQPHFADEDDFDSMQERHDAMTTFGLTVLHNSPRLIKRDAPRILRQLEACYLRDAGKGLPSGIVVLRRGAD